MTWSDVAIAAAFVLGIAAGTFGTIRLTRYLLDYLRRERRGGPDAGTVQVDVTQLLVVVLLVILIIFLVRNW